MKLKLDLKKDKNKIILSSIIGLMAFLLVTLIFIQFKSVEESNKAGIESLREDELKTQISNYKSRYSETMEKYEENMNKINEYRTVAKESEESTELLVEELESSKTALGLTDVIGEGLIITLKDTGESEYTAENIRYLINELKYAGAEAISINGNRIINLTDIVTVNDRFIVMYGGNERISSPYEIKVIGDQTYLTSTLNMKNTGFVDLMKSEGLEIEIEKSDKVKIDKYKDEIENKYMKEDE